MRSMLVSNDFYTASSITWFLKFLSVSKVVRLSSGLSIFQMARLLQLLPTVTSELWPSYKLFIDIHGMNQDWNVKRELNFYVFSAYAQKSCCESVVLCFHFPSAKIWDILERKIRRAL